MNVFRKIRRCIILKVAVPNIGDKVNQHFGRSTSFIIATVEDGRIKDTEQVSTEALTHRHKELADFLQGKGVSMVIAGGIGEGASEALADNGMDIIKGAEGSYKQVLEDFAKGGLKSKDIICGDHEHHNHEHYGHPH